VGCYGGGIHTPIIAFWPAGITAKKGSVTTQIGHVMDFMATFVDLTKAQYPTMYKGNLITPMQGHSLVSTFSGKLATDNRALYNEHYGARYVRYKDWKLVSLSTDSTWHLYYIKGDATELKDLSAKYPEKVKQLKLMWNDRAIRNKVLPKPGKIKLFEVWQCV